MLGSGSAELADASGDDGLHVVKRCGQSRLHQLRGLIGELELVFLNDGQRVRGCGAVRISGAGSDHIQRIADDVGEYDGKDARRLAQFAEFAALDSGKALAEGVDFLNIRTAGEQLTGDIGHFFIGDERLFKESRAAARNEKEHGILCAQGSDQIDGGLRGAITVGVRNGMRGFKDANAGKIPRGVTVFGNDHAILDGQAADGGASHLPGCFADGDQIDVAAERMGVERAPDGFIRLGGLQRGINDSGSSGTKIHENDSFIQSEWIRRPE